MEQQHSVWSAEDRYSGDAVLTCLCGNRHCRNRGGQLFRITVALGCGLEFGFVGATYLLSQVAAETERSYVQGINDTAISLGSSLAAFLSGTMLASFGWIAVPLLTVPLVMIGLVALVVCRRSSLETA